MQSSILRELKANRYVSVDSDCIEELMVQMFKEGLNVEEV